MKIIVLLAALVAAPHRVDPTPPTESVPQVAGPCSYGELVQHGKLVWVRPTHVGEWTADVGEITDDGKLLLHWINPRSGSTAVGLYEVKADGEISGQWGWSQHVKKRADGTYDGLTNREVLRPPNKFER